MSRHNIVTDQYKVAGRLRPDDAARERQKQTGSEAEVTRPTKPSAAKKRQSGGTAKRRG
jgi:hypothetical protein